MSKPNWFSVTAPLIILVQTWALDTSKADEFTPKVVISGQITDLKGRPVEGGEVYVYGSPNTRRPADFISPKTGKDGQFKVVLQKGKFWVVARVRKGEPYGPLMPGDKHSGAPEEFELGAETNITHNFIVADLKEMALQTRKTRQDFFTIQGQILKKDGTPLANRYVVAMRQKSSSRLPDFISGWTTSSGQYTFYILRGRYWIATAAKFPPSIDVHRQRVIEINKDIRGFNIEEKDDNGKR